MTRDQAIELARKHAKARPQSYYAEPFMPHEWVIQAILDAAGGETSSGPRLELMNTGDFIRNPALKIARARAKSEFTAAKQVVLKARREGQP